MSDKVSDERLREILAGCEGATPGPWVNIASIDVKTEFLRCEVREIDRDPTDKHSWPFRVCQTVAGQYANADRANFDHIARLDPATVAGIITELLSLRAQQQAAGWRVKPLEWRYDTEHLRHAFYATSIMGNYRVEHIAGAWRAFRENKQMTGVTWGHEGPAQAFAQSDYAARINSAIEPAPVAGGREQVIAAMSVELERHQAFADNAVKSLVWATRLYDAAMLAASPISASGRDGE